MSTNRRGFMKSTLLGAGAIAAGQEPVLRAESVEVPSGPFGKNPFSDDPVALRKLTDQITCSRIGLGTGMRGYNRESDFTRLGEEKAIDLLRYCHDVGIRLFDLADLYGSHTLIRKAFADKPRDSYTLITKIWGHPGGLGNDDERPDPEVTVNRFLDELGTEYIDLVQIHCMHNTEWPERFGHYFDGLDKLKSEGKIRAHGVSCHGLEAARVAATHPWVDAFHLRMNPFEARMDGTFAENLDVCRLAQHHGKGVVIMKVLGEGSITDPADQQKSIHCIANLPEADVMVVAFDTREQVDTFLEKATLALKTK